MKNATESLAGRVGIVCLNSFTYSEINGNSENEPFTPNDIKSTTPTNVNELFETIFKGGMPELYDIPEMSRDNFFESYIETYLSRDIKALLDIKM